jgi:hypothetical protein
MVFFLVELFANILGTRATCVGRMADPRMPTAPAMQAKINFRMKIVPADGTSAAGG